MIITTEPSNNAKDPATPAGELKEPKVAHPKLIVIWLVAGALVVVALAIFISIHFGVEKPTIQLISIDESAVTITPGSEDRRLVFCVAKSPNPSFCQWENSRELDLSEAGDYYAFAKDLDTGAISDYWAFSYEAHDFTQYRL